MKPFLTHEPTNGTCFVTYCTQFLFSARLFSTLVPSVTSLSPPLSPLREERISFPPKLVTSNYYKGDIARPESLPLRGGTIYAFREFSNNKIKSSRNIRRDSSNRRNHKVWNVVSRKFDFATRRTAENFRP